MISSKSNKQDNQDKPNNENEPTSQKQSRSIIDVINVYLKIIPITSDTTVYRQILLALQVDIEKHSVYAAPECISSYWNTLSNLLQKYNSPFYNDNDWAKAIFYICQYQYDNIYLKPYLNILPY